MKHIFAAAAAMVAMLGCAPARAQIVSGYDSGPVFAEKTPNSSSHAAGQSVGGLFSVPLVRAFTNGSGIATNFFWKFTGGGTGSYVVRLWSKLPTGTTCTDNTAYSQATETDDRYLIVPPFTITPAAPAVATGDTATYASNLGVTFDYFNLDVPATQNIYECIVTVSTDTADESKLIRAYASGPQN